ncbi:MAG: ferrous iron transport protein [Euryarchaeota archaeon]|nr:ferrous iron transport protein [Euryarchaeota archaeon]
METPITSLRAGTVAQITTLLGQGCSFQRKLRTMGIREGKKLKVVAIHPFAGPMVLDIDGRQITLGRSIAQRIMVRIED